MPAAAVSAPGAMIQRAGTRGIKTLAIPHEPACDARVSGRKASPAWSGEYRSTTCR